MCTGVRRLCAAEMYLSVGMQVVYPALDSKVKNVTLAYSVEHEDEVHKRSRGGRHPGLVV